mgnify:CR=1 FL=1
MLAEGQKTLVAEKELVKILRAENNELIVRNKQLQEMVESLKLTNDLITKKNIKLDEKNQMLMARVAEFERDKNLDPSTF